MTITTIQSSVTKTGAFTTTPDIDISGVTGDWELRLVIESFTADAAVQPLARFDFSDSVNAFGASLAGPHVEVGGPTPAAGSATASSAQREYVFKKRDYPQLRFGTASAVLRLALSAISGANASITYHAYFVS